MASISGRANTVLLVLLLLVGLAIVGMLATNAATGPLDPPAPPGSTEGVRLPGRPISGPTTITERGHYYLTNDILVSGSQSAILINTSDVSLDLGGFNVIGGGGANSVGIGVANFQFDVRIYNGHVRSFYLGISAGLASYVRIEDVSVRATSARGIVIGNQSSVRRCAITDNSGEGIVFEGTLSVVHDCHITDNLLNGVFMVGNSNEVEASQFAGNGWGNADAADVRVFGSSNVVRGNTFTHAGIARQIYITGASSFIHENSGCPIWIKNSGGPSGVLLDNSCVNFY